MFVFVNKYFSLLSKTDYITNMSIKAPSKASLPTNFQFTNRIFPAELRTIKERYRNVCYYVNLYYHIPLCHASFFYIAFYKINIKSIPEHPLRNIRKCFVLIVAGCFISHCRKSLCSCTPAYTFLPESTLRIQQTL